uniref:Mitochondrial glycoprotein n=1 Tax=Fagus sylvatica TaxID=28930 RepID=A0A2N9HH68_FAGSY
MARLIRSAQRTLRSSSLPFSSSNSNTNPIHGLTHHNLSIQSRNAISPSLFQARPYASSNAITKSPFDSNILRILRTEIEYQSEYAPPNQPVTKFNSFTVEDRAGEQIITMRGKYGENENVKIEATMFDGCIAISKPGNESSGQDFCLHLSLIVDISKGDAFNELEFVCSAWPNFLEVQKVYILSRDSLLARPYIGPDFRKLDGKIQKTLKEYLEARGVNDELAVFLHEYMTNKDRNEVIRWLANVKNFVEK